MSERAELLISLENVGVYYRQRRGLLRHKALWALDDVSLAVYRGESLGIIGRNAAGKSTLLTLLAGIITPDRGTMTTGGCRAALLSRNVGFIPHLTGRENAYLGGMLLGMRKRDMEECMEQIIEFADLAEFIDQPISTYSAGMRARLGFSVTFQLDPDVVLIDETLGVGDKDFKKKSTALMKETIRSDKTVVLVSHQMQTIRDLCTRVVWIDRGRTVTEGEPEKVLAEYESSPRRPPLFGTR